jgi:hypothetical protein
MSGGRNLLFAPNDPLGTNGPQGAVTFLGRELSRDTSRTYATFPFETLDADAG